MTELLAAKVKATNAANAYAMELWDKLSGVFAPFVGKKIEKADGCLLAKIGKLLPMLPNSVSLGVYRYRSAYSLMYVVKTCESIPPQIGNLHEDYGCTYYEASCYVGEMRDGVLLKLCDRPTLRADYTAKEVTANRAAYAAAKKIADEAQGKLHPFGEYDR